MFKATKITNESYALVLALENGNAKTASLEKVNGSWKLVLQWCGMDFFVPGKTHAARMQAAEALMNKYAAETTESMAAAELDSMRKLFVRLFADAYIRAGEAVLVVNAELAQVASAGSTFLLHGKAMEAEAKYEVVQRAIRYLLDSSGNELPLAGQFEVLGLTESVRAFGSMRSTCPIYNAFSSMKGEAWRAASELLKWKINAADLPLIFSNGWSFAEAFTAACPQFFKAAV